MNVKAPSGKTGQTRALMRFPILGPILLVRPRWIIAIVLGLACYFTLPFASATIRAVLGWDLGTVFFLVAMVAVVWRSKTEDLRQNAQLLDESATLILCLTLFGVVMSLLAIVSGLKEAKRLAGHDSALPILMAGVTILLSWFMTQASFALHYAHLYYGDDDEDVSRPAGGLSFPSEEHPNLSDFAYFSFVIGMTFQVSDVQITDRNLRIVAMLHGLVSFIFNTIIISMAVNIGSGLLS